MSQTLISERYTRVAIGLHWLIAVAIIAQLASGLWMVDALKQPASQLTAFRVYQWHKALGLIVLVLSIARLAWRLLHRPPPLPDGMSRATQFAATAAHAAFYVLMIGMPLIGWAMVSASPLGLPTLIFGLFEWPHLPYLPHLADRATVEGVLKVMHRSLGYAFAGLLLLHVAAALKHQLIDRDGLLLRMRPYIKP